MANKFEVKNNGAVVAHTESAGDNGTTNIVVSELTPETVYDKFTVSYLGKEESTVVPSFTTKAASNVPVTGVTMSQKTASMKVGDTKKVTATVAPENATKKSVTYSSSDEAIATVGTDGTITAVAVGSADITGTSGDGGFTDKCAVTVAEATK